MNPGRTDPIPEKHYFTIDHGSNFITVKIVNFIYIFNQVFCSLGIKELKFSIFFLKVEKVRFADL